MADNVTVDNGGLTDYTTATDDVGGVQYQKVKLDVGGDGVSVPVDGSLPVTPRAGQERSTDATLGALNDAISMSTAGALGIMFVTTTDATSMTASLQLEGSSNDGATWLPIRGLWSLALGGRTPVGPVNTGAFSGDAGDYLWVSALNNIGDLYFTDVRLRVSSYTSGSVGVRAIALTDVQWEQDGIPVTRLVALDNERLDVPNLAFSDGVAFDTSQDRVLATQSPNLVYNGATWDRQRGDAANGTDVDVTRLPALPAGTNNIGDVDVLTVPAPLSTAGNGTAATAHRVTIASDSTGVIGVTDNGGSLTVDGSVSVSNFPATQPVSAASLPLPTGASTAAKQPALGTAGTPSADVLTVQGVTSMTALKVDGSAVTQPVSGTVSVNALPAGTANIGDVDVASMPKSGTAALSNVAGSASSVTLLASNAARLGATIHNDSGAILYVKFGTTASTTSYTVKMVADAYYEVPFSYTGRIDGIWASATGSARMTELT